MTKSKYYVSEKTVNVNGQNINVTRINNDINGNPRHVIHFSDLGLDIYHYQNLMHCFDLYKYRAKWFGGGVVFTSYNIERDLENAINHVNRVLKHRRNGGLQ